MSASADADVVAPLADLVEHQLTLGWQVHVACAPVGRLVERLAGCAAQLHGWQLQGRQLAAGGRPAFRPGATLRRLTRRVAPDVVHLHGGWAGRTAGRGRVPTVLQLHTAAVPFDGGQVRRAAPPAAALLRIRSALRRPDLWIALSDDDLAEGRRLGIVAGRTLVLPDGVDVRRVTPHDRDPARERLGLGNAPLAVCLGRLAGGTGQDRVAAAWLQVRDVLPGARLALVGDGPGRATLKDALTPGVGLHAGVPDPAGWLAAADVVVVPARSRDALPVTLRAMAAGRPVVAVDDAGVAATIGDGGCTVPGGDLEALARAVVDRLADPGRAAGEGRRGRRRAVDLFDTGSAVADTTRATAALLPARRP